MRRAASTIGFSLARIQEGANPLELHIARAWAADKGSHAGAPRPTPPSRSAHEEASVEQVASAIQESGPIKWYRSKLKVAPLLTKQCTSLVGFGLGDTIAQLVTTGTINPVRVVKLATFGFLVDAPCGHKFYKTLDKEVQPEEPRSASAVAKKVAIDQLMYAPFFTSCLFVYLHILSGGELTGVPALLQERLPHTMLLNWCLWPIAHTINFKYVPTNQRILYNNSIAVVWSTILSYMAH